MKINKLNLEQICSVKSYVNAINNEYTYKEAIKFLSFCIRKEGFYYTFSIMGSGIVPVEEIEKSGMFIAKDKKVYYKPHLEIKMSNGDIHEKFFETEKELHDFMETPVMRLVNW